MTAPNGTSYKKLMRSLLPLLLLITLLITLRLPRNSPNPKVVIETFSQCYNKCLNPVQNDTSEIDEDKLSAKNTTCSIEVYRKRKRHQKVIAFTYYEDSTYDIYNRDYFKGIQANLDEMSELYPDYLMRVYYSVSSSSTRAKLCTLSCQQTQLDLCDVERNPKYGNASILYPLLWRFMPIVDAQVDLALIRDLDSLLSRREREAVREFERNSQAFLHVMRDNPAHDLGMLGGTWGAKLTDRRVRLKLRQAFLNMHRDILAYSPRTKAGPDQDLLNKYVYDWAKKGGILSHDSYSCTKYKGSIGFPTKREQGLFNFVGSVVDQGNFINTSDPKMACPEECRRDISWTHC